MTIFDFNLSSKPMTGNPNIPDKKYDEEKKRKQ